MRKAILLLIFCLIIMLVSYQKEQLPVKIPTILDNSNQVVEAAKKIIAEKEVINQNLPIAV